MTKTIHIIGGPTASGKSAKAIEQARAVKNPVIINADSMQIYDGMPTLTAQPSMADKADIPHILYGALHPNEGCSAGNWREMVEPLIADMFEQGQTPIVVGGSGLYINALVNGLSPMPDIADEVRARVNALYEELGAEEFYAALQARDPIMAARFHANHKARIIRAYEVLEATGQSLSVWQDMPLRGPPAEWSFKISLVMPDREKLYDRCNKRFEWMLDHGVLEEIKDFNARIEHGEVRPDALLTHALGYAPLCEYLRGDLSRADAIEQGQRQTRRYAKRQVTWFSHQIKEN